uniref:carbonic anhydrase n=1 Tax=Margaritifera margaritifera TaxID=102329 RepID=F5B6X4_PINMG|nr:nacrein C5 [Pinctada margaritifera]
MWRMTTLLHLTSLLVLIPLCHCASMHRHDHYMDMDQTYPNQWGYCDPPKNSSCKAGFSYQRDICQGPYYWHTISSCFKACASKKRQSPINIWSHRAVFVPDLPRLKFKPHMKSLDTEVSNHQNHAPEFDSEDEKPRVKLKNLVDGHYKFRNLHIHIGKSRRKGSEHSVDRHFTPMEAHLVFRHDEKKEIEPPRIWLGRNFNGSNEFVVVGVFLEVGDEGYGDEPDDDECKRILKGHYDYCDNNGDNGNNGNGNNGNNGGNGNNGNGNNGSNGNGDHGSNGNNGGNGNNGNNGDNGNGDNGYNGDNGNSDGRLSRWDLENVRRIHTERYHFSGRCIVKKARRLSRILECAYRHKKVREFKRNGEHKSLDVEITPEMVLPPTKYRQYYTYEGSLTTPPCTESVLWVVEKCHVQVSRRVLDALRKVEGYDDGTTLSKFGTRRPTQRNIKPVTVYKNFI